ncbi:MAG: BlaI/MecI/CopY family transcriptional regulator [Bacteroides sp.]|nr:BlaI/MecI/CopY family transcriptional regulator [Bacteroides sp.]
MNLKRGGRKPLAITEKELEIMKLLWNHGPMFVREMLQYYPDPKPHFNTVSTTVRNLEEKGYIGHEALGGSYRYHPLAEEQQFRDKSLKELIATFFNNSYRSAVSALVEEEKISIDELKEIIDLVEQRSQKPNSE